MSDNKFTEQEILKVVRLMVGNTSATGSHGEDMNNRVPNVKLLGNVAIELVSELSCIAYNWEDRHEYSMKAVGVVARENVNFIKDEILVEVIEG